MVDIQSILNERGENYGVFLEQARIEQRLIQVMRTTEGWERLENDQCSALEMISVKIARILNGNPDYIDNWDDIAGYAVLIANRLRQ